MVNGDEAEQSVGSDDEIILEGHISISAALESGFRPIYRILTSRDSTDRTSRHIGQLASRLGIAVERVDADRIASMAGGRTHGGLIALAGPRRYIGVGELFARTGDGWLCMIDGIEDPFNFGSAVRALHCAGVGGLVVRPRNWLSAAGVVARSSAGASERLPTAIAETVADAVQAAAEYGFAGIVCVEDRDAISLYHEDLTKPVFLVIGGEKRGITRSLDVTQTTRIRIPYGRDTHNALDTAGATAVVAFELLRQRLAQKTRPR